MGLFGLFGKKETESTLPANDTEKWLTGTYAMWSEYAEGDARYIAGSVEKNKQEGASMRTMLRRDWGISNREALMEQVGLLTALYDSDDCEEEDLVLGAWDLCRACQILAMAYIGGYIDRQEMTKESVNVGRIMQKRYRSWSELFDSYAKGYADWRNGIGDGAAQDIKAREQLCRKHLNKPDGACALDWNMTLTA